MGGKQKQSQRTKNNARPSSSGRSAELLSSTGSYFGFSGVEAKPLPMFFPMSADTHEEELNSDFALVIKKLSKKDPITKTKALQELTELVNSNKVEDVTACLGYWCRLYRLLSTDTEHKVREATQTAHGVIVKKCGRALAPYLKQVMPSWLMAQYDAFAPAASAAHNSLQSAFPEGKLPEVLAFCKGEILEELTNYLVGNTLGYLNNKTLSAEESERRKERVQWGALQALESVTARLPSAHDAWLWDQLAPALAAQRFWALPTHAHPTVRASWFRCVGRLVARFGQQYGEAHGARTLRALVRALAEPEPLAAAAVWDCLLLLIAHLQDWHQWVERCEELGELVLAALRGSAAPERGAAGGARSAAGGERGAAGGERGAAGGERGAAGAERGAAGGERGGAGCQLGGAILPLFAHLPPALATPTYTTQFLRATLQGLEQKSVLSSKSQRQAWISSLSDCIKYLSIHRIEDFAIEVITAAHRDWLEKVLDNDFDELARNNIIRHSASNMAALVKYWLRQSNEVRHADKYDQLVRNFWQNSCSSILVQVDKLSTDAADISKCICSHALFLQSLKSSFSQEGKKSLRFEEGEKKPEVATPEEDKERYMHNLNALAHSVCSHYIQFAMKKELAKAVLPDLFTIMQEFDSRELFAAIASECARETGTSYGVYGLYDEVFRMWLRGDTMRCNAVVDIVFLMLPHLSEDEQDSVFASFDQMVPAVVEACVARSLAHPYCRLGGARAWLRGPLVARALAAACARLAVCGDEAARTLLLVAFTADERGELMISEEACADVVGLVAGSLGAARSAYLDLCARLASQLACALACAATPRAAPPPAYMLLLERMPHLLAAVKVNEFNMSADTWWEVKTSWQDGLASLEGAHRQQAVQAAIAVFHRRLLLNDTRLDLKEMKHLFSLVPGIITNFDEYSDHDERISEIIPLTNLILKFEDSADRENIEKCAIRYDCLTSKLSCPFVSSNKLTEELIETSGEGFKETLVVDHMMTFAKKLIFRGMFLKTIIFGPKTSQESENEENNEKTEEETSELLDDGCEITERDAQVDITSKLIPDSTNKSETNKNNQECMSNSDKVNETEITSQKDDETETPSKNNYQEMKSNSEKNIETEITCQKVDETETPFEISSANIPSNETIDETDPACKVLLKAISDNTEELDETPQEADFRNTEPSVECNDTSNNENNDFVNTEIIDVKNNADAGPITNIKRSKIESKLYDKIWSERILSEDAVKIELASLLHDFELIDSMRKAYVFHPEYTTMAECRDFVLFIIEDIESRFSEQQKIEFYRYLVPLASKHGFYWAYACENYRRRMAPNVDAYQELMAANINEDELLSGDGFFHNLQAIAHGSGDASLVYACESAVMQRCFCLAWGGAPGLLDAQLVRSWLGAAGAGAGPNTGAMDAIVAKYYQHEEVMLYERELWSASWAEVASSAQVAAALRWQARALPWQLPAVLWDFTTISLVSLLDSVQRTVLADADADMRAWHAAKVVLLGAPVLALYAEVSGFVSRVRAECLRREPPPHVADLPAEWADIFAPDLAHKLFTITLHIIKSPPAPASIGSNHMIFLEALIHALRASSYEQLAAARRAGELAPAELAAACARCLAGPHHYAVKYLAYWLLRLLAKPLVLHDAETLKLWEEQHPLEGEESAGQPRPPLSLEELAPLLVDLQDLVDTALGQVRLGETSVVPTPQSDSHSLALGYLLLYDATLRRCALARSDLQHRYCDLFRSGKYIDVLLSNCTKLLPLEVLRSARAEAAPARDDVRPYASLFTADPPLSLTEYVGWVRCPGGEEGAGAGAGAGACTWAACRTMARVMAGGCGLATLARTWWAALGARSGSRLDAVVAAYVTPHVLRLLFLEPNTRQDIKISVLWGSREMVSEYVVEGRTMQLSVRLAHNHPLGAVAIQVHNTPITQTHWLHMYISHQNGSVVRAMHMWTDAVVRKVDASPPCYICYCKLHARAGTLPKVHCRQCRNKFHSQCIYKWFKKSARSSCPVCRTSF